MPPRDNLIARALRAELVAAVAFRDATERLLWARAATAVAADVPADEVAEILGVSRATLYRHLAQVDGDTGD